MGDGADSSTASGGRGLKRTPTRRYSTGSDAVPATAAGFQTPRATMAARDPHGWGKPRISTSHITNAKDKADAEEWVARLDTASVVRGACYPHEAELYRHGCTRKRQWRERMFATWQMGKRRSFQLRRCGGEDKKQRRYKCKQVEFTHSYQSCSRDLCEFFAKYPRESPQVPPYTQWKSLFHIHSHDLWISVRCQVCEKMRRVALEYLTIVRSRLLDGVWRRCAALEGVECGREDANTLCVLNFKYLFNTTRLQGTAEPSPQRRPSTEIRVDLEPTTTSKEQPDYVSEYGGTQDCIEGEYHSPALIEMWKSLGKSLRQPSYSGEGNPHHLNA